MKHANIKFAKPSPEKQARRRRAVIAGSAVAVLAVGAAAWAFWPGPDQPALAQAPETFRQLEKDERRAAVEDLGQSIPERIETLRAIEDPEQRRNAFRNMFQEETQKRMDEFFAAPAEEREAVLDKHIDERMKAMEERARRRAEREESGEQRPDRGGRGDGEPNADRGERGDRDGARDGGREGGRDGAREGGRRGGGGANNPAARAQRAEYRAAMRQRMEERGIEPPRRGGRGGGGEGSR